MRFLDEEEESKKQIRTGLGLGGLGELKVYVACKRKMLYDVIVGHQAYIEIFMGHRILQVAKTTRG